jgi:choline kinase
MESPEESSSSYKRQYVAGIGKRISGRLPGNSSKTSLVSQSSLDQLAPLVDLSAQLSPDVNNQQTNHHHHHHHGIDRASQKLLSQLAEWLQREKAKRHKRKSRRTHHGKKSRSPTAEPESPGLEIKRDRAASIGSDGSDVSLDGLQKIIDDGIKALGLDSLPSLVPTMGRRFSQGRKHSSSQLLRAASSDTDQIDGDIHVPSCDAILDNSKTMSYSGGKAVSDCESISSRRADKEKEAWMQFKNEIIRLAHTLRLKGWRRVPLDSGESISVERLSGALTNAVYVVTPPEELAKGPSHGKRRPTKVLLRIYGPQVEHLIDRDNELEMLKRLSRKRIGPRLLGTFTNGRFEQFFNAITLTAPDLREPATSKQIAKRMRELHDGIELLQSEVNEGPGVWNNWDSWLEAVEKVITFLDSKILSGTAGSIKEPIDSWKSRGLICGVEWPKFKATVEKYREFLYRRYGGEQAIREKLVFAHNDVSSKGIRPPKQC